jgi:hypothetical protein
LPTIFWQSVAFQVVRSRAPVSSNKDGDALLTKKKLKSSKENHLTKNALSFMDKTQILV